MARTKPTLAQQRELLRLEADLLRLHLVAAQLKNRRSVRGNGHWQQLAPVLNALPVGGLALNALTKPKRWRNKVLLSAVVAMLALLKRRQG